MTLAQLATLIGILVALLSLAKAAWSVAQFFIGLAEGLKNLTAVVTSLADRFDEHTRIVEGDVGDLRERVASLESWRDTEER